MKRKIIIVFLSCFIVLSVILSACEPVIPHSIDERKDCLSCHNLTGIKPYPNWHFKREYKNDVCTNCHELKINSEK